jgi:nitrogen fixation protein NifB
MKMKAPFHPCMNNNAHDKVARIHLPVAPECNIQCRFCSRKITPHDTKTKCPGRATRILTPAEALEKARTFRKKWGPDSIIGIAGPGDPLANPETFETLDLIRNNFPNAPICLCTNGLLLPDSIKALQKLNMHHISLTVNGVLPEIIQQITPWILHNTIKVRGLEGATILIQHQLEGIRAAADAGMFIKVNTVVVSRINGQHVTEIADTVKEAGANLFNPVPLIPGGSLNKHNRPACEDMTRIRKSCEKTLPIFYKCKQCRADANGIPGQEACA